MARIHRTTTLPQGILPLGDADVPLPRKLRTIKGRRMADADSSKRIAKLKQILNDEYDGVQARLATKLEVQPDYLSRMLNGKKGLSGDMARIYEQKLNKPKYYLDEDSHLSLAQPKPEERDHVLEAELKALAEITAIAARVKPDHRARILNYARDIERMGLIPNAGSSNNKL